MSKQNKAYSILYEGDNLLIINKSAGILSVPDRFDSELPNLKAILERKYGKIWVVHRLDRETSGAMVFAKEELTHKNLNEQFQKRLVDKKYWVLVKGIPTEEEGVINKPIGAHPSQKGKMSVRAKGKESYSEYRVLEKMGMFTLLEVSIKTGRTHQIRVHLPSIKLPLAVDPLYGIKELKLSEIKRKYQMNKTKEERPLLKRCSLHARSLRIIDPLNGENRLFEADLPKDFEVTLKQLRKYGQ